MLGNGLQIFFNGTVKSAVKIHCNRLMMDPSCSRGNMREEKAMKSSCRRRKKLTNHPHTAQQPTPPHPLTCSSLSTFDARMPKNGKKKRKLESVSLLSNITGFEDATGQESLDACLAEFQNSTAPQIEQTKKSKTDIPLKDRENFDQIESWNRSFLSWVKGGNYPPGLLPNVDEELSRNFRVKELSTFLLGSGNDLRMPIFERWLLDSKLEEEQSRDHVIPVTTHPKSQASIRLIQELLHNGLDRDDAERVAADLCRKTNVAGHELSSQGDRYRRQSPLKKGDRMRQEDHSGSVSLIYSRKKWKKPFCFKINLSHYQKLKDRFFQLHNQVSTKLEVDDIKTIHAFNILVLALLLRYSALSGKLNVWGLLVD